MGPTLGWTMWRSAQYVVLQVLVLKAWLQITSDPTPPLLRSTGLSMSLFRRRCPRTRSEQICCFRPLVKHAASTCYVWDKQMRRLDLARPRSADHAAGPLVPFCPRAISYQP